MIAMRMFLGVFCAALCVVTLNAYAAEPLKVVMISASKEYDSDGSLAIWKEKLEAEKIATCSILKGVEKAKGPIEGLDALATADVLVIYCRRIQPPPEQLEAIKKFVTGGKPVIGIRTASHGLQDWLAMDKEILGGSYNNHYGDEKAELKINDAAKDHPVLAGVTLWGVRRLYKNPKIADDATLLLSGFNEKYTEPVAWVRTVNGGRVFYTSLGTQDDFKEAGFLTLLTNGLKWVAETKK